MNQYYRIVFVKNKIIACNQTDKVQVHKLPYCEQEKGEIKFAVVEAPNESQARSIAKYMALEALQGL
jgi:hypothetical protein